MIIEYLSILSLFVLLLSPINPAASERITKETIDSHGTKRTYYLFVPDNYKKNGPLIVTLHGSGHNGASLVEEWKNLASKEGIILAGPDSSNSQSWASPVDGPDLIHDVVEAVKTKYAINPRRVYLFGHSGGAVFALQIAVIESEYFAAAAIHAGAWRSHSELKVIDLAKRKIPIAITVGDRDQFFPLRDVNATCEALKSRGFTVQLSILGGHDHDYYSLASTINPPLWAFLAKQELMQIQTTSSTISSNIDPIGKARNLGRI